MDVQEAIKDRGVIAILRLGDSIPGEYQAPLIEQLDMANYERNCLSATQQNQNSSTHGNILDKGGTLVPVSLGTPCTIMIPLGDRVQKNGIIIIRNQGLPLQLQGHVCPIPWFHRVLTSLYAITVPCNLHLSLYVILQTLKSLICPDGHHLLLVSTVSLFAI